jgi:peptidoglycan/LPS O-acetylase OafA/YrhL
MSGELRLDGIDILRGVAVTGVVLYHFFVLLDLTQSSFFSYVHAFGSLGVPLFFIISGYLIYRSIDNSIKKRGRKDGVINYLLHRFFRIAPAYYFNLFVLLILAGVLMESSFLYSFSFFKQILSNLTFTSYFFHRTSGFGFNGAYWTLNIEMLWYILAPILLIYVKRDRVLLLLSILSFVYLWAVGQGYLDFIFGFDSTTATYRLELQYLATQLMGQISYFIAGIFIYKYSITPHIFSDRSLYILTTVIIVSFITIGGYFGMSHNILLNQLYKLSISIMVFILLYATKIRGFDLLEWVGKISYSLYLWHMPILFVMKRSSILSHLSIYATLLLFTILLLIISSLSYYLVEEGGFVLRKRVAESLKR